MLQAASQVATWRVDMASVYQLTAEEAEVARRLGDPWEVAFALAELALGQYRTGRADDAVASIEESVREAARLRNPTLLSYSGLVFGIVARHRHPDRAFRIVEESIDSALAVGNDLGVSWSLGVQAALLCERGEWVPAAHAVIGCVAHLNQAGCLAHGIQALGFAAVMLEQAGDDTGAATLCGNPPLTNITAFWRALGGTSARLRAVPATASR